jgi:uncharacterized protein YciI
MFIWSQHTGSVMRLVGVHPNRFRALQRSGKLLFQGRVLPITPSLSSAARQGVIKDVKLTETNGVFRVATFVS